MILRGKKPKFKVWADKEKGIVFNRAWGDFDFDTTRKQAAAILEALEEVDQPALVLNDLSEYGKATSGARKIYALLFQSTKIKKQAFICKKTVTRVMISFIMRAADVENIEFFEEEAEALQWLK